jgi:hypothetical protein
MSCGYEVNDRGFGGDCNLTGESCLGEDKCPLIGYFNKEKNAKHLDEEC